jgi:hypothetical protein
MAIELYKPFLIYELIEQGIVGSIKTAKNIIKEDQQLIASLLKKIFFSAILSTRNCSGVRERTLSGRFECGIRPASV